MIELGGLVITDYMCICWQYILYSYYFPLQNNFFWLGFGLLPSYNQLQVCVCRSCHPWLCCLLHDRNQIYRKYQNFTLKCITKIFFLYSRKIKIVSSKYFDYQQISSYCVHIWNIQSTLYKIKCVLALFNHTEWVSESCERKPCDFSGLPQSSDKYPSCLKQMKIILIHCNSSFPPLLISQSSNDYSPKGGGWPLITPFLFHSSHSLTSL